jgi:hypothetical protein
MKPGVEKMTSERNIPLTIIELSVPNRDTFLSNGVRSVPTVLALRNGNEVGRSTGAKTPIELTMLLNEWSLA